MGKLIYNVTINIDHDVHDEWLIWMKHTHIPQVMNTGLFTENKLCKVLVNEEQGITYSIQYLCDNRTNYDRYQQQFAPALQQEIKKKFEGKYVAFRTLLEII